jgi:protein phosphatase
MKTGDVTSNRFQYEETAPASSIERTAALTHIGNVRTKNEDRYLIRKIDDDSWLLAVADGLGGETDGDVAAEMAISALKEIRLAGVNGPEQLVIAVSAANKAVMRRVLDNLDLVGMGTTVTAVMVNKRKAHWVHVGDSRLYLVRGSELIQVTRDQTLVQFLLDEGEITPAEAQSHHSKHVLDQCVGCRYCAPESGELGLQKGDILVLMTDGLHDHVDPAILKSRIVSRDTLGTKAERLIENALSAGGKDNITIVLAEIDGSIS